MCSRRWSPGCGVNRRCRASKTLSLHAAPHCACALALLLQERGADKLFKASSWGRLGDLILRTMCLYVFCCEGVVCVANEPELEESLVSSWHEQFQEGSHAVVERDSLKIVCKRDRFPGFRGKCLQAAVVASLQGHVRERVLRRLQKDCANNDGSGFGGTLREGRNLRIVEKVLAEEGLFLYVYESSSASAMEGGRLRGPWRFGAERGVGVGAVAWLRDQAHVARLVSTDEKDLACGGLEIHGVVPPWYQYVVGAPKKNEP